ncbi:hypothetical protein [Halococcus sediminicola]|uniref:hypothetical protein n=1 Tax=Halococcus sediminicola TaxID=1264579 RepID=UPI0012AB37DF|nr:hypothetical protein [Halococcus sediminicola]
MATLPNELQKGDFLYTNWGYNQTNREFAKIIEVSDTRKTAVCSRVKSRTLEGGNRRDEKVMPVDEEIGETFRLHVRESSIGDEPREKYYLTGTYPTVVRDGENVSTRKGNLYFWNKTSVAKTRPGMGH